MIKSLALLCLLVALARAADHEFCWRDSYGRGVGKPVHVCPPDLDKSGALCYPKCKAGYYGVGPVCWANCPPDMKDTGAQCHKESYGRGVGKPLHTCNKDQEKNGALCYPKCSKGHYGVGPVCWQDCPREYHDDGALCRKNPDIYGKGCCCTIWGCCDGKCPKDYHNDPCTCRKDAHIFAKHSYGRGAGVAMSCAANEDQQAGLCYPKARPGFKGVGPVAWQICHGETIDFGAFCTKKTYGRTAGTPMICDPQEDWDAALCYTKCAAKFHGVGPVCWGDCPKDWASCGAGCAVNAGQCAGKIIEMIAAPAAMVGQLAATVVGAGSAITAARSASKIAKMATKSVKIGTKVAKYTDHILTAARAIGEVMTPDEAQQIADQTISQAHENAGGLDTEDAVNLALDVVEMVDPTGVLSAARAFIHPKCSQIH